MQSTRDIAFACLLLALAALALGTLNTRTAPLASNTMLLCLGTVAAATPLSLILAVALFQSDMPTRGLATHVMAMLMFFPLYLQAAGWNAGFGPLGWQTSRLDAPWLQGWPAAIWIHTAAALPWATLIIGRGLRNSISPEVLESATVDAGRWSILWHVLLPTAGGPALTAALWIVVGVAAEMTVADLFLIRTYAEELYTGFALGQTLRETWLMLLPSLLGMAALSLATSFAILRLSGPLADVRAERSRPLFGASWTIAGGVWGVLGGFYGLPIASLVWQAGQRPDGWSLQASWLQVEDAFYTFSSELKWSLIIATLSATVALAVALLLVSWSRRGNWAVIPAATAAALGLAVPGPLWALSILWLLNRPGLAVIHTRTIASPVLAIAIRCLPLAILILWHGMRTAPTAVIDAAQVDGANRWQLLCRVIAPLRWRTAMAAWIISCAIAMGDLAGSILVLPPAVETAAIRLFGLLHAGVREQEAGLALATLTICFAISAFAVSITKLVGKSARERA